MIWHEENPWQSWSPISAWRFKFIFNHFSLWCELKRVFTLELKSFNYLFSTLCTTLAMDVKHKNDINFSNVISRRSRKESIACCFTMIVFPIRSFGRFCQWEVTVLLWIIWLFTDEIVLKIIKMEFMKLWWLFSFCTVQTQGSTHWMVTEGGLIQPRV